MSKSFRFRPLGWLTAIGTLAAMAGALVVAAPGSAAATEKPIEKTFEAECVLAPGTLNLKGTITVTEKGSVPESVSPGEEVTSPGNTLTITTPASWGSSFASLGAKTARGKILSTILDVSGGEPATLQIAKPPEFPSGLPFETVVEPKPLTFLAPSGPEAGGKTSFPVGPIKVTGAAGETAKLTVDTKPGFKETTPGHFESTGEGIQSEATGYNEAGEPTIGPVPVSCNAPAGVVIAEIPIVSGTSSTSSTSSATSSTTTSSTSETTETSSPTTTTTSPTTTTSETTETSSPTTTTTSPTTTTTTSPTTTTSSVTSTTTSAAGAPEVTRVLPPSGPSFGFTPVLIEGRNLSPSGETCFLFSCSGVTVKFGETEAFVLFASPERDVVFSPPHTPGPVEVTVTVNGSTSASTPADTFTYRGFRFRFPFEGSTEAGEEGGHGWDGHGHGWDGHHHDR